MVCFCVWVFVTLFGFRCWMKTIAEEIKAKLPELASSFFRVRGGEEFVAMPEKGNCSCFSKLHLNPAYCGGDIW